jgi:hypothetical protein
VQPDAVVVELCRSRQAVMYPAAQQQQQQQQQTAAGQSVAGSPDAALMSAGVGSSSDEEEQPVSSGYSTSSTSKGSNPLSLSGGGGLLPDFQRSLELGGTSALMLRLVLGRLSAGMSGKLGVIGGAEFVAARQEAEARGAQVCASWGSWLAGSGCCWCCWCCCAASGLCRHRCAGRTAPGASCVPGNHTICTHFCPRSGFPALHSLCWGIAR